MDAFVVSIIVLVVLAWVAVICLIGAALIALFLIVEWLIRLIKG